MPMNHPQVLGSVGSTLKLRNNVVDHQTPRLIATARCRLELARREVAVRQLALDLGQRAGLHHRVKDRSDPPVGKLERVDLRVQDLALASARELTLHPY